MVKKFFARSVNRERQRLYRNYLLLFINRDFSTEDFELKQCQLVFHLDLMLTDMS